jgi:hypothetical protein
MRNNAQIERQSGVISGALESENVDHRPSTALTSSSCDTGESKHDTQNGWELIDRPWMAGVRWSCTTWADRQTGMATVGEPRNI